MRGEPFQLHETVEERYADAAGNVIITSSRATQAIRRRGHKLFLSATGQNTERF